MELVGSDEVSLQSGCLNARVPAAAVGFTVATSLARVVDLGTEFDVVVQDSGAITTLVHEGKVSLRPQNGRGQTGKSLELTVNSFDHATVSIADVAGPVLPVVTVAGGDEGRYAAMISLDGKTAEFHSPDAFAQFQDRAWKQLRAGPGKFRRQWPALVEAAGQQPAVKNIRPNRPILIPPHASDRPAGATVPNGARGSNAAAASRVVEVKENGKTISISDSKDSGITVTITESVDGRKRTTQVNAATAAELARKNPYAHRLYRQYRPRPKTGKARKD